MGNNGHALSWDDTIGKDYRHTDVLGSIQAIKNRLTITEGLERYAGAKIIGNAQRNRIQICCPFHDDRNPSMTVYLDSNKCRCYAGGCQASERSNDVIDVVQMAEGISSQEAIHRLMDDLGIVGKELTEEAFDQAQMRAVFDKECREALKVVHGLMDGIFISQRKAFHDVHSMEQMGKAWDKKGDTVAGMYKINNKLLLLEYELNNSDKGQKENALKEVRALMKSGGTNGQFDAGDREKRYA